MYEKLQSLCKSRGFEISNLGAALGINLSKSAISKWKTGAMPRAATLKCIADYFGVPVSFLTDGSDEGVSVVGTDKKEYEEVVIYKALYGDGNIWVRPKYMFLEHTFYNMVTMITGALINIALDPILIFGWGPVPSLGVKGAAIATVFAQSVSCLLGLYLNQTRNKELRLNLKGFRPWGRMIRQIYTVGVPSVVMQSIASVMTVLMNLILIGFGNAQVSVLGVYF